MFDCAVEVSLAAQSELLYVDELCNLVRGLIKLSLLELSVFVSS